MLSKQQIAGLRELHRVAHDGGDTRAKVNYMVAADEALPALLDELDALRALRARVEAVIQAWRIDGSILPSQDFADELVRLLAVDAGEVG